MTFKKWYLQLSCLVLGIYGRLWRTSRQVRLLCPGARHLTGRPRLYVEDRWPRQWRLVVEFADGAAKVNFFSLFVGSLFAVV